MGANWDREVDLLVVGAGGAGLTAGLVAACEGLKVLVAEKTEQIGGTTATSGGTVWVPLTQQGLGVNPQDDPAAVRRYLTNETGAPPDAVAEAFLATAAEAIDYLARNSEVKFKANTPYPDYHPEADGGAKAGRALNPLPFDAGTLGRDFALVRPPVPEFMVLGGMMVAREEIKHLIRPWRSWAAFSLSSRRVLGYLLDRLRGSRGRRLVLGNALIGRLFASCRQRGVEISVSTALTDLVREGERIVGAVLERAGKPIRVKARHGVVLAGGGCAASAPWRERLMGNGPAIPDTLAFAGASGETLDIGLRHGARLGTGHESPFFWMPASRMRWRSGREATYPHIRDRPKPGLIAVNREGRRFVNEGASYHDFASAMLSNPALNSPAHLIFDRAFLHDFGVGMIHPVWQWPAGFERAGYLISAPTLEALAGKIGVPAAPLREAVERHNADAATGVDTVFGKGASLLARNNGDPDTGPNPCLRPIAKAPFYAVAVHPAPIGSSAGLATDADAQVIGADGAPIGGLYAVGNDMNSIMRGTYPGPGITLGPALVFAYRAARHAGRSSS